MGYKRITKKFLAIFFVFVIFVFNTSVGAAEKTARLRNCLETNHLYHVLTPDILSKNILKRYDDKFVAFTGIIRYNSIAKNNKQITVYGSSIGVQVDTSSSSVMNIVSGLRMGDYVTVYGQVDGNEVDAEHIVVNPEKQPEVTSYVFFPDKEYNGMDIQDLARDGHVRFKLPASWDNKFVSGRLNNNDVNGYQFFLNAIYPQNTSYPENFYMFYFSYETYLDAPPKSPTSGDHKDLEKLVIKNIVNPLSGDFDVDIDTLKLADGNKFDYCSMVYKPADGNDYRLEFFFKPDKTGLVCMLYLYYPNDTAVNHLLDAAYVVQTLEN